MQLHSTGGSYRSAAIKSKDWLLPFTCFRCTSRNNLKNVFPPRPPPATHEDSITRFPSPGREMIQVWVCGYVQQIFKIPILCRYTVWNIPIARDEITGFAGSCSFGILNRGNNEVSKQESASGGFACPPVQQIKWMSACQESRRDFIIQTGGSRPSI